jgi:hypothetical protein
MLNTHEGLRTGGATRCAVCDGKFGLVRHYSWRTQLCSTKCVDRFRNRRQSDCKWVGWLQNAFDKPQETARRCYDHQDLRAICLLSRPALA